MRLHNIWLVAVLLAVPCSGRGSGFSIYEQSARGMGAAGAYTARVADPSAIFYNPAGLAQIETGSVGLGSSLIFYQREFAGANPFPGDGVTEDAPNRVFYPSHAFWGHRLSSRVSAGFGIYSPFGLSTEWENPDSFSGRFISTKASLTPFYFNPCLALTASPRLRLGVGIMAVHSTIELNRHVGEPNPTGDPGVLDMGTVSLSASNGLDFGVNLGFQFEVSDRIVVGGNFRSTIDVGFDGDADFTFEGTGTGLDPQLALVFPDDQSASTSLSLPDVLVLALAVVPREGWVIEGDVGWMGWSRLDRLNLRFADENLDFTLDEDWKDSFYYRFGVERRLDPHTEIRFGFYYDETPQPAKSAGPIIVDANRYGLSAGVGKSWAPWSADLFAMLLLARDRDTEGVNRDGYDGKYANGAQIVGVSVGYSY